MREQALSCDPLRFLPCSYDLFTTFLLHLSTTISAVPSRELAVSSRELRNMHLLAAIYLRPLKRTGVWLAAERRYVRAAS